MSVLIIIPICLTFCFVIKLPFLNSFKDICKKNTQTFCLKTIYNLFYVYSVCEINCIKAHNYILPYIKTIQNNTKKFLKHNIISRNEVIIKSESMNTRIEVYNDTGLQVLQKDVSKRFEELSISELEYVDDFSYYTLIITDLFQMNDLNKKNIQNKKIINNLDKCDFKFEISDITFIALYLNYNDVRYNINLKTDEFNFYVVGNIINKSFIQYYIKNILDNNILIKTDNKPFLYKLELMDHEVKILELNENQYIIIDKNGYRVDGYETPNIPEIPDDYIKI
jgi:hypothetical protein